MIIIEQLLLLTPAEIRTIHVQRNLDKGMEVVAKYAKGIVINMTGECSSAPLAGSRPTFY